MDNRTSLRGRPKLMCDVLIVRISLALREGEDDDLRLFFCDIPPRKRALAIKIALRSGAKLGNSSLPISIAELDETLNDLLFE